jgi:light-independent protochlorophyllide reductase subunit B
MGFEGANVLFDTWVHPLMMGLEEHLLGMFREDFEFHEGAAPSHLGRHSPTPALGAGSAPPPQLHDAPALMPMHADAIVLEAATAKPAFQHQPAPTTQTSATQTGAPQASATQAIHPQAAVSAGPALWIHEAELELKKIPFFVRGEARRNTERYALEKGLSVITIETLYDAKAHFGR